MTPWHERSIEERNLLNPGFCATLLWHAAQGYASARTTPMAIEVSFLVLPFTREALVFGGSHGLLSISQDGVRAHDEMKKRVNAALKTTSDEVRECARRAEFLGRWLEKAGGPETVMALLGVQP